GQVIWVVRRRRFRKRGGQRLPNVRADLCHPPRLPGGARPRRCDRPAGHRAVVLAAAGRGPAGRGPAGGGAPGGSVWRRGGAGAARDGRRPVAWWLSRLTPLADAVRALQADGCRMDVSCFWVSASGHGGPSVRPAQMGELARLNLELWFDVYLGSGQDA